MPELLEPEYWPPNSPDLNPLDYAMWGPLESNIFRGEKIREVDHLKRNIVREWENVSQEMIDNSIDRFRKRLHAVIRAEGGHFEHLL